MKLLNHIKNKKGVGLVECMVALLLFSIITGSVLTVFSSSRDQIKRQNDQYKIELMANNILAAYEGSNSSTGFGNCLKKLDSGLSLTSTGSFNKTIGTEGTGKYSFDTDNIPVPVPFSKIVVTKDAAVFKDKDNNDLIRFAGTYPDGKLQDSTNWSQYFKESELKYSSGSMTLSGVVNISGIGDCDFTYTTHYNGEVELICNPVSSKKYGQASGVKKTGGFENYLLRNGYYLKCIYRKYDLSILGTTYDYFYFQVYNVADNAPVKNSNGKCLFYKITIATNDEVNKYYQGLYINMGNDSVKMYFDFDNITGGNRKGNIQYGFAADGTAYDKISFNDTLKDENGNNFTGDWYYYPWLVANTDPSTMSKSGGTPNMTVSCTNHVPVQRYHEYTAKSNVKSDIYYALNAQTNDEMLLFNSDAELIFPFQGDTDEPLNDYLIAKCEFGLNGSRNTQALYNEKTYDKWYLKGAVPAWDVSKAKFTDGGANGTSKIIFYGKDEKATENEYITFSYSNYQDFKDDRDSILNFTGDFSEFYDYSKTYSAKNLKNTNNASELQKYAQLDAVKEKLGTKTTEKTLKYYTVSTTDLGRKKNPRYEHTYTYYSYKLTTTETTQLVSYSEKSHTLEIQRNGASLTWNETVNGSVAIKTTYTYAITPLEQNKTVSPSPKDNNRTPVTPPAELQGGKNVDGKLKQTQTKIISYIPYRTEEIIVCDYTDKDWVWENQVKNTLPTESSDSIDDIVSTSKGTGVPENLDTNWTLGGTALTEVPLHSVSKLSSFLQNNNSYDVQVLGNAVFTAHPTSFKITAGEVSANETSCLYDIVGGEKADVKSETYYIVWTSGNITLVAFVTYSNYTKRFEEQIDGVDNIEPKIMIWSMPKNKVPADVKTITDSKYNKYLYRVYRKG